MKAPLIGGAYTARSYIADAQRCVNLFPEINQQDAPFPTTHYLTPGLIELVTPLSSVPVRCAFTASNGDLFLACGNKVYFIDSTWMATELGTINPGNTPVSMADNTQYVMVVDGSRSGWTIALAGGHVFAAITDPDFLGGDFVLVADTFFILNEPGTQFFYFSDSNGITFNALAIAAKSDYSDNTAGIAFTNQRLWVFGEQRATELWYNAGQSPVPFLQVQGVTVEKALIAPYSMMVLGSKLLWLGRDTQGSGIVYKGEGQDGLRVSTYALEDTIQRYNTLSDAVGWGYQLGGHEFYVLTFPSGNATWVLDLTTGLWHQWAYMEDDGSLSRHRGMCHAFAYGKHVVGDWENGKLYELSNTAYDDDGQTIPRIRSWPHFIVGLNFQGQPIAADGKRLIYNSFLVEMETGASPDTTTSDPPMATLRLSYDKGKSWVSAGMRSIGATGQYARRPQWWGLGLGADVVFEISWSGAFATALNGAYVDSKVLGT